MRRNDAEGIARAQAKWGYDMSDVEQKTGEAEIICRHNGPLRITGKFVMKDPDGNVFDTSGREFVSLCRCGHSANKPFCDGAHKTAGFESEVRAQGPKS